MCVPWRRPLARCPHPAPGIPPSSRPGRTRAHMGQDDSQAPFTYNRPDLAAATSLRKYGSSGTRPCSLLLLTVAAVTCHSGVER